LERLGGRFFGGIVGVYVGFIEDGDRVGGVPEVNVVNRADCRIFVQF